MRIYNYSSQGKNGNGTGQIHIYRIIKLKYAKFKTEEIEALVIRLREQILARKTKEFLNQKRLCFGIGLHLSA